MKTVKKFFELKRLLELSDDSIKQKGFLREDLEKELKDIRESLIYIINLTCWVFVILFPIPIAIEEVFNTTSDQAIYTSITAGVFIWLITAYIRGFN